MNGWGIAAIVALVIVLLALFAAVFMTVVGVMESRLGLSQWEAISILILASVIFGSSSVGSNRS